MSAQTNCDINFESAMPCHGYDVPGTQEKALPPSSRRLKDEELYLGNSWDLLEVLGSVQNIEKSFWSAECASSSAWIGILQTKGQALVFANQTLSALPERLCFGVHGYRS